MDTDAFLYAGAVRTHKPDQLVWHNINEGTKVLASLADISKLFYDFVQVEMQELAEIHVKETAMPFSQRNIGATIDKRSGILVTLSRIARGKEKN